MHCHRNEENMLWVSTGNWWKYFEYWCAFQWKQTLVCVPKMLNWRWFRFMSPKEVRIGRRRRIMVTKSLLILLKAYYKHCCVCQASHVTRNNICLHMHHWWSYAIHRPKGVRFTQEHSTSYFYTILNGKTLQGFWLNFDLQKYF